MDNKYVIFRFLGMLIDIEEIYFYESVVCLIYMYKCPHSFMSYTESSVVKNIIVTQI